MDNTVVINQLSENFLERLHLYRGNPFRKKQADLEEELQEYFVPTVHFYRMMDLNVDMPRSAILSATRGAGKTANRRILEACLRDRRLPVALGYQALPPVLVVPYTHFDWLLKSVDNQINRIDLNAHICAILRKMVSCLVEQVVYQNYTFASFLSPYYGYFLNHYSDLCHPIALERYIHKFQTNSPSLLTGVQDTLRLACQQAEQAQYLDSYGYMDLLEQFLELIEPLGFKRLVVLIDRIDELNMTASNPELVADFVEPLLKELQMLEMPGLIFKFFLPDDAVKILFRRPGIRIGEKIPYYHLEWDTDQLVALVRERLMKLSGSELKDMGQFADSEAKNVTQILAHVAEGSPRNLFRLHELLLLHLEEQSNDVGRPIITLAIVNKAIDSFLLERQQIKVNPDKRLESEHFTTDVIPSENMTELQINDDFSVQYYGNKVHLNFSPHELSLLRRLLKEPNRVISHDELLKAIYPDSWNTRSESDLTSTLKRLRRKLATLPGRPEFIKTKRGHGYILNPHPQTTDDILGRE